MPTPTNPKKRALMPSTKLRRTLRAAGHHLNAIVQVGKEGVTDPVVRQLDEALLAHELVKVKVGTESPEDRFEAADRLGAETGAQIAQVLGRTVLVYRRHPEHPRYEPLGKEERAEILEKAERRLVKRVERRRAAPKKGRGSVARERPRARRSPTRGR